MGVPASLELRTTSRRASRCRVPGVGCRVPGVGCRVSGVGCRVSGQEKKECVVN